MQERWYAAWAFAFLWPFAGLMHLLSLGEQGSSALGMGLWALGLLAMLCAGRTWALALFCGAQMVEVLVRMPWVANHWAFFAWVNLVLLVGMVVLGKGEARWRWPGIEELLAWARRPLLFGVVLLYCMAAFHKLNADYWAASSSCALELWASVPQFAPLDPESPWPRLLIAGSLILELTIPALLLFARTRWAGVLLGAGFHVFLGFVPYETFYNFSTLMLALYLILLPRDSAFAGRLVELVRCWAAGAGHLPRKMKLGACIALVLFGAFVVWDSQGPSSQIEWNYRGVRLFCLLGPLLWVMLALALRPAKARIDAMTLWPLEKERALTGVLLALLGIHAVGPYVGWKSELSFSMYSNLRVRDGQSNHWLVPKTLDLWGWQSDWVSIRDSSSERLQWMRRNQQDINWVEFQDLLARDCDIFVRFTRAGKRYKRVTGDTSAPFATPLPWWKRKLIRFRPLDRGERQRCVH